MEHGSSREHLETLERLRARRRELIRRRKRRRRIAFASTGAVTAVALLALLILGSKGVEPTAEPAARSTNAKKATTNGGNGEKRDVSNWRPWKGPVPILMYHPIEEPVPGSPYPDLFLTRKDFIDQVEWLARAGYEAVTLTEVLDSWFEGGTLPPKPVVLTFDDGYVSQYENAFPVMKRLGWPGVLNLKALDSDIYDRQVEEMARAGWQIASHSVTHPDLPSLTDSQLSEEMNQSRRLLEEEFGVSVTDFCYPAGRYDGRVIAAVREAGYRSATSTEPGLARPEDRWSLDRIRIELGDGAADLESKLASAGA